MGLVFAVEAFEESGVVYAFAVGVIVGYGEPGFAASGEEVDFYGSVIITIFNGVVNQYANKLATSAFVGDYLYVLSD